MSSSSCSIHIHLILFIQPTPLLSETPTIKELPKTHGIVTLLLYYQHYNIGGGQYKICLPPSCQAIITQQIVPGFTY